MIDNELESGNIHEGNGMVTHGERNQRTERSIKGKNEKCLGLRNEQKSHRIAKFIR